LPNQIILGYNLKLNPAITTPSTNQTTEERVCLMEERHAQATAALNQVAEKSGTPSAQYNTGDQVWLEGKNLRLLYQATKLAPKRYRPFKIIKEISLVAYQLALPVTFLGTWPIFFFSFLPVMYLYDHMIPTHMTAYLYNRAILSGTSLFPPFVRFLLFSSYGSL